MERRGVTAQLGQDGLYRFSFKDQHGLSHSDVAAERLYRGARPTASPAASRRTPSGPWVPA